MITCRFTRSKSIETSEPFAPHLEAWLRHIRTLAEEIGPRGSTTEGERRGHQYCRETLEAQGLETKWETFRSAKSAFHPFLIVSLIMLLAFILYPLSGRLSAAAAGLIALGAFLSALMELSLRDNPLRLLVPKGTSQNVVAVTPPQGEIRQDLVLIGHDNLQS